MTIYFIVQKYFTFYILINKTRKSIKVYNNNYGKVNKFKEYDVFFSYD